MLSSNRKFALTRKQKETLDFIKAYMKEHDGLCPSYEEIKDGVSLKSKCGVNRLVNGLKERGHIDFIPHKARSIVIIE